MYTGLYRDNEEERGNYCITKEGLFLVMLMLVSFDKHAGKNALGIASAGGSISGPCRYGYLGSLVKGRLFLTGSHWVLPPPCNGLY